MRMQICDCMLTLGGEARSITVQKENITVAEAAVLNAMHGEGAISNPVNIRTVSVNPTNLKSMLAARYLRRAGDAKDRDIADKLFPGMTPNFPATFDLIGVAPAVAVAQKATPLNNEFSIFEPETNEADASLVSDTDTEDADDAAELNTVDEDGDVFAPDGSVIKATATTAAEPAKAAKEEAPTTLTLASGKAASKGEKALAALVGA